MPEIQARLQRGGLSARIQNFNFANEQQLCLLSELSHAVPRTPWRALCSRSAVSVIRCFREVAQCIVRSVRSSFITHTILFYFMNMTAHVPVSRASRSFRSRSASLFKTNNRKPLVCHASKRARDPPKSRDSGTNGDRVRGSQSGPVLDAVVTSSTMQGGGRPSQTGGALVQAPGPSIMVARPLPRVLLLHTGGTLGMDPDRSYNMDGSGT